MHNELFVPYGKLINTRRLDRKQCWVIVTDRGNILKSYDSYIVALLPEGTFLNIDTWDYSVTTGSHRNLFLGESKKETERKIKKDIYKVGTFGEDGIYYETGSHSKQRLLVTDRDFFQGGI